MFLATLAFLALLLAPSGAWAWGPITHLAHGADVLADLTILGAALQQILRRHRLEYLYGCVGADITQAKKYTRAQQAHCHSWEVGWSVLERATTDAQRAFAYGYLTHLAGDCYSHNHFVPTQLIVSYSARTLRHVYWEARFDTLQHTEHRQIIRELRNHRFSECEGLVRDVVSRTIFPFRTDKRIFDSFIAVHDLDQWYVIMRRLVAASRYALPQAIVGRYNAVCRAAVLDVLTRGKKADCQRADPTGIDALSLAKEIRVLLRTLERRGAIPGKLRDDIAALDSRDDLEGTAAFEPLRLSVGRG
ncbi:zinc dependent phospholipase C family protein [Candidatus Binatia bacterium]|nr:zinc dependent phospholipase C family protein [Candidatus Binatia bacterium]